MHSLYDEFVASLEKREKENCVKVCLDYLANGAIDVVTLYEQILAPAMNTPSYGTNEGEVNIWEEHSRTSIVRTIIECCYPYVVKERNESYKSKKKGSVIVLCPTEEAHETGARMVADFFTVTGFDVIFIGASTPGDQTIDAINYFNPDYVAISITNAYNLLTTAKVVKKITDMKNSMNFKIILGGRACQTNPETCKRMNPDYILQTFDDIRNLAEGEPDAAV